MGGDLLRDLPKRLLHLLRLLIKRLLFVEKNVIVGDFHLEQRAGRKWFYIFSVFFQYLYGFSQLFCLRMIWIVLPAFQIFL